MNQLFAIVRLADHRLIWARDTDQAAAERAALSLAVNGHGAVTVLSGDDLEPYANEAIAWALSPGTSPSTTR